MKLISKRYFSFASKAKPNNNYYFDFHKEKGINPSTKGFDNIYTNTLNDENYKLANPNFPLTNSFAEKYIKQVIAVCLNTKLLESKDIMNEAKEKANQYLKVKGFNIGAYSDSKGLLLARKNIANWYLERDGYKINEDEIYLTNGGMNSYDHVASLICKPGDSIIIPNPCYPLYKRYNESTDIINLEYNYIGIEEGNPKEIDFKALQESINQNRQKGLNIKAMLVVNPHNPLGFILTESQMEEIIKFCEKNQLVLIAVESLQNSLHSRVIKGNVEAPHSDQLNENGFSIKDTEGKKVDSGKDDRFKSFRYMINKTNSKVEMFSINSISKGPFYNGAIRGGLLDYMNIDEEVAKQLYKYKSIDLCSGVPGQIFIDLSLTKPKEFGYEFLYNFEKSVNDFNKLLLKSKNEILEKLEKESNYKLRNDVNAGYSIFLKNLKGKKDKDNNGQEFGTGMENYTNFYINI